MLSAAEGAEGWLKKAILRQNLKILDNIVTFWRPAAPLAAGSEQRFDYRLAWCQEPAEPLPLARVIATRGGQAVLEAQRPERLMVVDFDLGMINFATLEPKIEAPRMWL